MALPNAVNNYDYARSHLQFRSDRVNHTPRLQLDASCRLRGDAGQQREFVLTAPCIGESMYVATGLIHQPSFEFLMIAEHQSEYAIVRRHASADRDNVETHRLGEPMSTQSGVPARVVALDVYLATHRRMRPITTYEAFHDALLGNRPINGRTTYLGEDGKTQVILEYPAKTTNVGHDRPVWQVDTGPVLVPDFDAADPLQSGRFRLAHLVFNRWDYAELALRCRTEIATIGDPLPATAHYSELHSLSVTNELFVAGDDS